MAMHAATRGIIESLMLEELSVELLQALRTDIYHSITKEIENKLRFELFPGKIVEFKNKAETIKIRITRVNRKTVTGVQVDPAAGRAGMTWRVTKTLVSSPT